MIFFISVLAADLLIYIPAVLLYCLYLTDGNLRKKVSVYPEKNATVIFSD